MKGRELNQEQFDFITSCGYNGNDFLIISHSRDNYCFKQKKTGLLLNIYY